MIGIFQEIQISDLLGPFIFSFVIVIALIAFRNRGFKNFRPTKVKVKSGPIESEFEKGKEINAVEPKSIKQLRDVLKKGGGVKWIDRGAMNIGTLRTNNKIAIIGKMKLGKTREAVKLIEKALAEEIIDSECIFVPSPKFLNMESEVVFSLVENIDPRKTILLFIDEFARFYDNEKHFKYLTKLLNSLDRCKDVFVIVTARSEKLEEKHRKWLSNNEFKIIKLPKLNKNRTGELIDNASVVYDLEISEEARSVFIKKGDGTPELILMSLRRLDVDGERIVTKDLANKYSKRSISESWADTQRYIIKQEPIAKYLFFALDVFYATNTAPHEYFVLQYAKNIWRTEKLRKLIWLRKKKIKEALAYLEKFDIVEQSGIINHSEFVTENKEVTEKVKKKLSVFLLNFRKLFQNKIFKFFYKQAEDHAWILYFIGNKKYKMKEFQEAEEFMVAAAHLFPHRDIYNYLGIILHDLKRYDHAEEAFRKAIDLDMGYALAYGNLGWALQNLDRDEEAEEAYREAIDLDPNSAFVYNNLGTLLEFIDRVDEAEETYQKAIEVDPNFAFAYNNYGSLLYNEHRLNDAIPLLEKSIELEPRPVPALNLAGIYKKLDNKKLLRKYIEDARSYIKEDDWYNLACLENICGDQEKAIEYLKHTSLEKDFNKKWAWKDPNFEDLREDERFKEITGPRSSANYG